MAERGKYTTKVVGHGQMVWDALAENPGGCTMVDLIELTKLTRGQVRKAFEYIRDIFATDQDQPIIYIPGKHRNVYKLAEDRMETQDDYLRRLASWRIQFSRVRTAIMLPAIGKWGDSFHLGRINHYMENAERELAYLVEDLGKGEPGS